MFMSTNLVDRVNNEYIQSPIDDIESFLWVTLYAKLNNKLVIPSPKERAWAEDFESEKKNRDYVIRRFSLESVSKADMNPLVDKWDQVIRRLSKEYYFLVKTFLTISETENGWENEEEEAKYWRVAWHGYALQGICQSLELLLAYIDR